MLQLLAMGERRATPKPLEAHRLIYTNKTRDHKTIANTPSTIARP
jgi:hypothetical protein